MMRMRTCPGTCHMTHSWSERRSCGNILSGTFATVWEVGRATVTGIGRMRMKMKMRTH